MRELKLKELEHQHEIQRQLLKQAGIEIEATSITPDAAGSNVLRELIKHLAAPTEIIRGPDGRATGSRKVLPPSGSQH